MAFTLDKIVPWGRSFEEYVAMFALSREDLGKRILGCGDGPASFNSMLTKQGGYVISADPLYRFSAADIGRRIDETYEEFIKQTRNNKDEFVWQHIPSVEELGRVRMEAMKVFLSDYPAGRKDDSHKCTIAFHPVSAVVFRRIEGFVGPSDKLVQGKAIVIF